jgi:hypothetical protein
MNIKQYPLKPGQWVATQTPKKYVVWHGTTGRTSATPSNGQPGRATSTIDAWNSTPERIGTPWLVDRDGTIFKTFDDREWIAHLGIKNTQQKYDKASVGIEIANEVDLQMSNGKLYAFGKILPSTKYVGQHFEKPWRGGKYWAKLDEVQVDACIELTLDICNRFSIDPVFYYPSTDFDFPKCFEEATILCHSNCRKDKTDLILEDWVWDKIKAAGIRLSNGS